MAELARTRPEVDDALPLGPQSLVWRYFGDNRMVLIGPRPAVLQNMLAELGQGVLTSPRASRAPRRCRPRCGGSSRQ